jgi:hypothetical protein
MSCPTCDRCNSKLINWIGNVMVDSQTYHRKINYFEVWCKECTNKLDQEGIGERWHSLWELHWVRDDYEFLQERIQDDIKNNRRNWGPEALEYFKELGALR